MGVRLRELWSNPIAGLAARRWERSRGFIGWVVVPALLAGPLALLCAQRPPFVTPVLKALLMGRLSSPGPGETFALPILVVAFLALTVMATVPQATLGVARERERRTLEPLLLTRMRPAAILLGELVQVLLTPVLASLALLPLLCISFWLGSIGVGSLLMAFTALLMCHLLFASSALCASCWCRRTGVAMVLGYGWVLLLSAAPLLLWQWQRVPREPAPWWMDSILALHPIALLANAVLPQRGIFVGGFEMPFALVGGGAYALLSLLFFRLGVVGLERR
jgi:ABC-type Na+ efflux pump permease subunit